MKKMYKAMLLVLCAVMLVVASVMGTLAYLQMQTGAVTNTFTVGNVTITLDESKVDEYGNPIGNERVPNGTLTGNAYKLIPGHTYTKDPTIHVAKGSEVCYLFVKVTSNLPTTVINVDSLLAANGWTELESDIWYKATAVDAREAKQDVTVFGGFTISADATNESLKEAQDDVIAIVAYAIQADGFNSAAEAWTAAHANFT